MNNLTNSISSKFYSKHQKLCLNIIRTNNWLVTKMQEVFKASDLTMQQYSVMKIMQERSPNPCSIQFLKDQMLDRQSDVSRLVARLASKGMVETSVSESDRRRMDATLTTSGHHKLEEVDLQLKKYEIFLDNLEEQDIDATNQLLDKLTGQPIETL